MVEADSGKYHGRVAVMVVRCGSGSEGKVVVVVECAAGRQDVLDS